MEHWAQIHGVDHQRVRGKLEPDDLGEIAARIGSNSEHLRWVGVRVEIDHDDGVLDNVKDCLFIESVLERRAVELHTRLS